MSVTAVLFDVDDTLIDHRNAVRTGFLRHLARVAPHVEPEGAYTHWHELEGLHYGRYLTGELSWQGQRRERVRDLGAAWGLVGLFGDEDVDAWFDGFRREMEAATAAFTDALTTLDGLGVPVGVVSNNETTNVRAKLARCGLGGYFDVVICPDVVGVAKPDPGIFLAGCAALRSDPATTAYVGDLLHTDAIGARDAGLVGVWLDRQGGQSEPVPAQLVCIASLHDLTDALGLGTLGGTSAQEE